MSKMNLFKSILTSIITKVSTPLRFREGLGVGLLLFLLASCGPDGNHGRVKGSLAGISEADIIAFVDDTIAGGQGRADTVKIKRGSFSYDREVDRPTILTLVYPNFSTTSLVLEPGKTVKLKGDANRLSEIEVDGNDDNNLLTEFRKHTLGKRDAEVQREAATFIRTHAKTMAAVVLFRDVFATAEIIESNPTESLLAELQKAQPATPSVQQLATRLKPLLATAPGKKFPAFTATDIDGKSISSSAYDGKNVLIVFCAQWDASFYNVKRHSRELDDNVPSGKLSYLFVSFDTDKQQLISSNKYEPLPGRIIYDGKGFSSPLMRQLGMRYISGSILVGSDGKIKARDIPCAEWKDKIPNLL